MSFVGVFHSGNYGPPVGFCFDQFCQDEPMMDDPLLADYNVERRASEFADACQVRGSAVSINLVLSFKNVSCVSPHIRTIMYTPLSIWTRVWMTCCNLVQSTSSTVDLRPTSGSSTAPCRTSRWHKAPVDSVLNGTTIYRVQWTTEQGKWTFGGITAYLLGFWGYAVNTVSGGINR